MRQLLGAAVLLPLLALPALGEPIRLTGRIEPAGIPGARVELLPYVLDHAQALRSLDGQPPEPRATARPAADGSFELTAPEPGFYSVAVRADGSLEMLYALVPLLEGTELPPVRLQAAGTLDLTVLGPSGKPADGIRIQADARLPLSDGSGWQRAPRQAISTAEGRVALPWVRGEELTVVVLSPELLGQSAALTGEGKPVLRLQRASLVHIEARDLAGRPLSGALLQVGAEALAVTGRDGRTAVGAPAAGGAFWLEAPDGRRAMLTLLPGESVSRTVTLSPPEMLTGRVVDARTRAPLPGALVWSQGQGTLTRTRTETDGSFRLATAPGQSSMLTAAAPGYVSAQQGPGAPESATLALQPTAVLSGLVLDAEGRPVAGARVRPLPVAPTLFGFVPQEEVRTGADGRFRLRRLAAGAPWRLRALAQGFAPGEQTATTGEPGQSTPPVRIVLGAGTSLAGRLVDPEGRPVPGAQAMLRPAEMTGLESPDEELRITSEADGRFRFARLGAGAFDLLIEHPGFAPAARTGLQVTGRPPALDLGDLRLTPGAAIEGRVSDEQGRPVAQAFVSAASFEDMAGMAGAVEDLRTGPDGRFRIGRLKPGREVDVHVTHPAYVPFEAPGVEVPRAEPLEIVLRTAHTLTGRVMDGARRPVQAQISRLESRQMSLGGSTSGGWGVGTAGAADEEGRFVLGQLAAGTVDLRFEADGFRPRMVRGIRIPEREDPAPLEVVLEAEAALEGRVVTAAGAPAAGLWISAVTTDRQNREAGGSSAQTDAEGRYRIGRLGSGAYTVHVHRNQGVPSVRKEISLSAGGTYRLDWTLSSGAVVSGRVVDGQGEPVVGAAVTLASAGSPLWLTAVSTAGGAFRLAEVEEGLYRIEGSAPGYAPTVAPDPVRVEGPVEVGGLELRLLPGATIKGRLLGVSRAETERVVVQAMREDRSPFPRSGVSLSGSVAPEGLYRISSVGVGTWQVLAILPSGRQASGTVQVSAPAEEVVLDLELSEGLTLSGRLLLDGAPLAGAEVGLGSEQGQGQLSVRSRYDGGFTFEGLQPGPLVLAVLADGMGQARKIELAADLEMTLDIRTGLVAGQILAAGGQPVAGAAVALQGEESSLAVSFAAPGALSDERGSFEVRLAAGSYRISVTGDGFAPVSQTLVVTPGGTTEVQVVLTPR